MELRYIKVIGDFNFMNIDTLFKRAIIALMPSAIGARAIAQKLDMSGGESVATFIMLFFVCGALSLFLVNDGQADPVVEKWRLAFIENPFLSLVAVAAVAAYGTLAAVALLDLSLVVPVGTVGAVISFIVIAVYAFTNLRGRTGREEDLYADFFDRPQPHKNRIKVALGIEWTSSRNGHQQMSRRMVWAAV